MIEWVDSVGCSGWEYTEGMEPIEPALCTSVGFLVDDSAEYKTIIQTISHRQVFGRTSIPSVAILRIMDLAGEVERAAVV